MPRPFRFGFRRIFRRGAFLAFRKYGRVVVVRDKCSSFGVGHEIRSERGTF